MSRLSGLLLSAALLALAAGEPPAALAFTPQAETELIDPSEIPSVHNTLYRVPEGVVSWDVLGHLEVEIEVTAPLRATFHTSFSKEVEALDGTDVRLMGFLYPLEGKLMHEHFLLTAWPPSCPFCLPAGAEQMVDVYCAEPIEFGEGAILVEGRFELLHEDPSGLYYRLQDAVLVERFDDIRWTGSLPDQPAPNRYQIPVPAKE